MSKCISRHGEFSSHEPDADHVCWLAPAEVEFCRAVDALPPTPPATEGSDD